MSKDPKVIIKDGGVIADFICSCGNKIRVSVWGMVYRYSKKGTIISARKYCRNVKKCKCGKIYIFVAIPELMYKELKNGEIA